MKKTSSRVKIEFLNGDKTFSTKDLNINQCFNNEYTKQGSLFFKFEDAFDETAMKEFMKLQEIKFR